MFNRLDQYNLALLVILLLIPLLGNIDRIKIGSFFEVELHKKVVEAYKTTDSIKEQTKKVLKEPSVAYNEIKQTIDISPEAALIKLAMSIEDSLRKIYSLRYKPGKNLYTMVYVEALKKDGILSPQLAESIMQFQSVRNMVLHHRIEKINPEDLKLSIATGLNILEILDIYEKQKQHLDVNDKLKNL